MKVPRDMQIYAADRQPPRASESFRSACAGEPPLDAKIERWMENLIATDALESLIRQHGSPLNIVHASPMRRNLDELDQVAADRNLDFQIFFARKSNKCLAFVDEAKRFGAGIDTASENEIRQCMDRQIDPNRVICTAAVKCESLVRLCLQLGICIAIDNDDELRAVAGEADRMQCTASVALRLGGFHCGGVKLTTRFGFDVDRDCGMVEHLSNLPVKVRGVHFHLDGYDAGQRVAGIRESLVWIERLRSRGHHPTFIDMGGGFPTNYLESEQQWNEFWNEHETALLGGREPITYQNHGLGRMVSGDTVIGSPKSYPYYQSPVRADWLASILDADVEGSSVATQLRTAELQLRCEPGRSLMDGCGMTVARVEFRKQNIDGDWLIGLSMNRTQCRTSSDDFLVDPLVVSNSTETPGSMTGYLVGAYCTESELLSLRRLHFPRGIRRGDLVVFPNTAGYLMHFLESRSHQFPLAKNVVFTPQEANPFSLDPIDDDSQAEAAKAR